MRIIPPSESLLAGSLGAGRAFRCLLSLLLLLLLLLAVVVAVVVVVVVVGVAFVLVL